MRDRDRRGGEERDRDRRGGEVRDRDGRGVLGNKVMCTCMECCQLQTCTPLHLLIIQVWNLTCNFPDISALIPTMTH